ncbi:fem1a, partial [Symbiodinium sp. CCMP2456]
GAPLEDDAELDVPMDVQLVMLPLETRSFTSKDAALVEAAAEGKLELVAQLLAAGADKDGQVRGGWAPLHAACRFGQTEVVTLLLDAGVQKDVPGPFGDTPLCCAVNGEHADIVELLLRARADPDRKSPILKADGLVNTRILNLLLEYGADKECLERRRRQEEILQGLDE